MNQLTKKSQMPTTSCIFWNPTGEKSIINWKVSTITQKKNNQNEMSFDETWFQIQMETSRIGRNRPIDWHWHVPIPWHDLRLSISFRCDRITTRVIAVNIILLSVLGNETVETDDWLLNQAEKLLKLKIFLDPCWFPADAKTKNQNLMNHASTKN